VTDWLPDGSGLILDSVRKGTREDILLLELGGEPATKPLVTTSFAERLARLSPDGNWLA
jgi:hypothetical protein